MNTSAQFQRFVTTKRYGVALLIFVIGLLTLPAAFAASGIYLRAGSPSSWRPALDYFEWLAAAFGLLCCVIAAFIPKISITLRIFLCLAALGIYIVDLLSSALIGMIVFGPSF